MLNYYNWPRRLPHR